jgi:hypothetical protein
LFDRVAIAVAQLYFVYMLQRTLPAGFIAPCLPTKTDKLPSGSQWLFIVWPLPGYRFASDRLATILRQEKVSGVELAPAPKLPTERGARVAPATLTACMPKDRARELSQRFGIS